MNSQLKDNIYDIPQNILNLINHTLTGLNGQNVIGVDRANNLLTTKKVTYSQLKKIIHELTYIDKNKERLKYNLMGGDLMLFWSKQFLNSEREFIKNKKESSNISNEIGSIDRKNPFLKKHQKKDNYNITNPTINTNSKKSTASSLKLFEEINRIKKLMK